MQRSLKHSIASKLVFASSKPEFVDFRREGDKYILEVKAVDFKVVVSKECVDFTIQDEVVCVKTGEEVYRIVRVAYIAYKLIPLGMFIKRVVKVLISILK